MIEICGLTKFYGDRCIFRDLSFEVKENACTAFSGDSGLGKTTLLRCVSGLEVPDGGFVSGLEGKKKSFVFQENRLIENVSALDNILCVVPDRERAKEYLEKTGLADSAKKKAGHLSGGMKRRLSLARALAYGGDAFFLDEPLRELDENTEERMLLLLKKELEGKTVILISHEKKHTEYLAESVIRFSGTPMDIE